jgi:hypothetical protein
MTWDGSRTATKANRVDERGGFSSLSSESDGRKQTGFVARRGKGV